MIKIDVQGAEMIVPAGAWRTLRDQSAALFIEVDEKALAAFGTSPAALFAISMASGTRAANSVKTTWSRRLTVQRFERGWPRAATSTCSS